MKNRYFLERNRWYCIDSSFSKRKGIKVWKLHNGEENMMFSFLSDIGVELLF